MRKIKVWEDPYGMGFDTCIKKEIEIKPGLTVLVGCNGSGKTTLLKNIKEELDAAVVPVSSYNDLSDGRHNGLGWASFNERFDVLSDMMCSSEGENISINLGRWLSGVRNYLVNGIYKKGGRAEDLAELFADDEQLAKIAEKKKKLKESKERWILIDATDSGYSIDNIVEAKALFNKIIKDSKSLGKEAYIIVSANEYELANGEQCFDVIKGEYVTFDNYEEYKELILRTRKDKEKRYEKLTEASKKKGRKKNATSN